MKREQIGEAARRVESLLEQFSRQAETARDALSEGDLGRLEAALAARDRLMAPIQELLASLAALDDSGGEELDGLWIRVQQTRDADTSLRIGLEAERQHVAHELDLLDEEEVIRFAYGQTTPTEGRKINLVR